MQGHICRLPESSRGTRNTWAYSRCGKMRGPSIMGGPQAAHQSSQLWQDAWSPQRSVFIRAASALVPVCLYNVWVGGNCGGRCHQTDINTWWGLNEVQYCSTNIIIPAFSPPLAPPHLLIIFEACLLPAAALVLLVCLSICLQADKCTRQDGSHRGPLAW